MITIVGLGPSGRDYISMGAYEAILNAPIVFIRTIHHPIINQLESDGIAMQFMDYIYESADTFDNVYTQISDAVIEKAKQHDVVYAVPGHPMIGELAVEMIISKAVSLGIKYRIIGSESFIDASMAALRINLDSGLKIIDALSINKVKADTNIGNLIYQVYNKTIASDVKLALMEQYDDDYEINVIEGAGTETECVSNLPLYMLDRRSFDHLTTVYVPPMNSQRQM